MTIQVESIMMFLIFYNSLGHINNAFEFLIYIAPITSIGSIFIFQGAKKKIIKNVKKKIKVLKQRSGQS
jgi:hypothetical protein